MPSQATPDPDRPPSSSERFDLVLVGGGLQNGLILLGALARQPDRRIALVESRERPGGNHTWCLHGTDIPDVAKDWVLPLMQRRWSGYDVHFPRHTRRLQAPYFALGSGRFAAHVQRAIDHHPNARALWGRAARRIDAHRVLLDDGTELHAELVVDARGPGATAPARGCGFQKFVGLELELATPHGLARPLLMDATVPQQGGLRFFYVLPLGRRRLLVEDTVFSLTPQLARNRTVDSVRRYAERYGPVAGVVREEHGVLPMPWSGAFVQPTGSPLTAGYAGGFFHPATGYSFPAALKLASHLAERPSRAAFDGDFTALCRAHHVQHRYARQLNRLLFNLFQPEDMWNVLERFYRLPEPLIQRFYAMEMSRADRARLLLGRPPRGMSLGAALSANRTA